MLADNLLRAQQTSRETTDVTVGSSNYGYAQWLNPAHLHVCKCMLGALAALSILSTLRPFRVIQEQELQQAKLEIEGLKKSCNSEQHRSGVLLAGKREGLH